MTYLSHPMHSLIQYARHFEGNDITPQSPGEYYHLLSGLWSDGSPIVTHGDGYDTMNQGATTLFLYHGDPRDTMQWSEINEMNNHSDIKSVSSVYLDTLKPGAVATIETAYTFHQDSTLNALEQLGFMHTNIDSLLKIVPNIGVHCQLFPTCLGRDCVWPGDFNHNGIADHYDLLYWGVALDSVGAKRAGLINWIGHYSNAWSLTLPDNLNAKHADANGNGRVTNEDLERNETHFLFTNPFYSKRDTFPLGPELSISAFPMDTNGDIRRINIYAQKDIPNVLGIAFELDYDTTFFRLNQSAFIFFPVDTNIIFFKSGEYLSNNDISLSEGRYAYVKTNHLPDTIHNGFQILFSVRGLALKDGFTIMDLPDTIVIRLKNLIALDPHGNDLHIGANTIKIPNYLLTGIHDFESSSSTVVIYPNPADQTISIETELESDLLIFNSQGQLMKKINRADIHRPIDISALSPGLYILQILETGQAFKFVRE